MSPQQSITHFRRSQRFFDSTSQGSVWAVDYGVVADGSTDNEPAITSMIADVDAGTTIIFPNGTVNINDAFTVTKSMTLFSYGGTVIAQQTASKHGIIVSSSNVTIGGLEILGTGDGSLDTGNAIQCRASSFSSPYTNINVRNCYIKDWSNVAVNLHFVTDFDVSHNYIEDITFAGVYMVSCLRGRVSKNDIRDINVNVAPTGNGYGVSCTRDAVDSLVTDPRCEKIAITNNTIDNIPLYKGIDTHGGRWLTIANNIITGCQLGITIIAARKADLSVVYAASSISIIGNTLDSLDTTGDGTNNLIGISVQGSLSGSEQATNISITGNSIKNYGNAETAAQETSGAGMVLLNHVGTTVSGNTLEDCGPIGINLRANSDGFQITGNSFIDCWGDAATNGFGIQFSGDNHTGLITGNYFGKDDKVATGVGVTAFRWDTTNGGTNSIHIGENVSEYTNYFGGTPVTAQVIMGSTLEIFEGDGKNTLELTDTGTFTGMTIGGDVTLYRDSANVLATDDQFRLVSAAAGSPILTFYQSSTIRARIQYRDSGDELWVQSGGEVVLNSADTESLRCQTDQRVTFANDIEMGAGGPRIIVGSGTPEGNVSADVGSIFMRTDGSTGTSVYVKESGTGTTLWVGK